MSTIAEMREANPEWRALHDTVQLATTYIREVSGWDVSHESDLSGEQIVIHLPDDRVFHFGTVNGPWGASIYNSTAEYEEGGFSDGLDTPVDGDSNDAVEIAGSLIYAVIQFPRRRPYEDVARLDSAIDNAKEEFWQSITRSYPEIKSGDCMPGEEVALDTAMRKAVVDWLRFNFDSAGA